MYPALFQIFTRIYLDELSNKLGRAATLADVPNSTFDDWAESGFDFIWLLGVWQIGEKGKTVSRMQPEWQTGFRQDLPDLTEADIGGSPFAITSYTVHRDLGGETELLRFRERLTDRGMKLMLDFVPNHTAIDHPWVMSHPAYFVQGSEKLLLLEPQNYIEVATKKGTAILAHGRDPYFDGWPDTLQLNYGYDAVHRAMAKELRRIAKLCDGVRCDMAMLVLPEIFEQTWGTRTQNRKHKSSKVPFWQLAIEAARSQNPDFIMMAEVYWDREWTMLQNGFDYAYDKQLYDRLRSGVVSDVRGHFAANLNYQNKMARFLENHDEPRAAKTFSLLHHKASAVLTFLSPGLRFFYEGQFEGRKSHASVHLNRRQEEAIDPSISEFYRRLLRCLKLPVFRTGQWQLLECDKAWGDNPTHDQFIAFSWTMKSEFSLIVVNVGETQGQCRVRIGLDRFANCEVNLTDLMTDETFRRSGNEMNEPGLFVDLPAWGFHVFKTDIIAIRQ